MVALAVVIYIWLYVSITMHEFGHFFAARFAGATVISVMVGGGPVIFRKMVDGVEFEFRLFPREGLTRITQKYLNSFKKQQLIFSAAGLLVNLTLLLIFISLIVFAPKDLFGINQFRDVLVILVVVEIYMIGINIYPRSAKLQIGGELDTDGKRLLTLLRMDQSKFKSEFIRDFHGHIKKYGDSEIDQLTRVINDDGQSFADVFFQAQLSFAGGRYGEAVSLLELLAARSDLSIPGKAFLYDYLSSVLFLYGQKDYLSKATSWIDQAQALLPECKTLLCSRGLLMIESGDYEEGIEILLPFINSDATESDQIIGAAYLAKAECALGNLQEAQKYMEMAERSSIFKAITDRIRQECQMLSKPIPPAEKHGHLKNIF